MYGCCKNGFITSLPLTAEIVYEIPSVPFNTVELTYIPVPPVEKWYTELPVTFNSFVLPSIDTYMFDAL